MPINCNQCSWIRNVNGQETWIAVWMAPFFKTDGCVEQTAVDLYACVNQVSSVYSTAPGSAKPTKLTDLKIELDLSTLCGQSAIRVNSVLTGDDMAGGDGDAWQLINGCGNSPTAYPKIAMNNAWYANLDAAAPTHLAKITFRLADCENPAPVIKLTGNAPLLQFTDNSTANTHNVPSQAPGARHEAEIEFATGPTKIRFFSEASGQTGIGATNTHNGSSNNYRFVLGPPIGGANSVYPIQKMAGGDSCATAYGDYAQIKYTDETGNNSLANNPGYYLDVSGASGDNKAIIRGGYSAGCGVKGFSNITFRFGYKSTSANAPSDDGITINALVGGVAKHSNKNWTCTIASGGKNGTTDWYDVTMSSPVSDNTVTKPIYDWELYTYANGGGSDVLLSASLNGGTIQNHHSFVICTDGLDVRMSNAYTTANSAGEIGSAGSTACGQIVGSCDSLVYTPCQKNSGIRVVDSAESNVFVRSRRTPTYDFTLQYKTDAEITSGQVNADSYITALEFTVEGFAKVGKRTGGIIKPIQVPLSSPIYRAGCMTLVSEPFLVGSTYRQTITVFNPGMAAVADPSTEFKSLLRVRTKGPYATGQTPKVVATRIVSTGHQSVKPMASSGCGSTAGFGSKKQKASNSWTGDDGTGYVSGESLVWLQDLITKKKKPSVGAAASAGFTFHATKHKQTNNGTATLTSTLANGTQTAVTYKIKNDGTAVGSNNEFNACATKLGTAANFAAAVKGQARGSVVFSGFPNNNEKFVLTDAGNTAKGFVFKGGVQTADGSVDQNGDFIIGLSGLADVTALATRIKTVINTQTAVAITASVGASAGVVVLVQDAAGTNGNKTISGNVSNSTLNNLTGGGGGHFGKLTVANAGNGVINVTQGAIGAKKGVNGNTEIAYAASFQNTLASSGNPRRFTGGKTKTIHFWAKIASPTNNDYFDVYDLVALYTYYIDRAAGVNGIFKAAAPGATGGQAVGTILHAPSDQCGVPFCKDTPKYD